MKAILMEVRELSRLESKIPQDGRKLALLKRKRNTTINDLTDSVKFAGWLRLSSNGELTSAANHFKILQAGLNRSYLGSSHGCSEPV